MAVRATGAVKPGPSRVTIMLAQFARDTRDGCLDVLGAGWTQIPEGRHFYYIAGILEFPWDAAGEHIGFFDLLDENGAPVNATGPSGSGPVRLQGKFGVAPNPGVDPGTPLSMPFVMGIEPPLLTPGSYEWRLQFEGVPDRDWRVGFKVVPVA